VESDKVHVKCVKCVFTKRYYTVTMTD